MLNPKPRKKQTGRRAKPEDTIAILERCLQNLRESREVFKQKFPQTYASLELRTNGHK